MTLLYEGEVSHSFDFDPAQLATSVIKKALEQEGFPYEAEVSLLLTDDSAIHELNADFREVDSSTDVLSFPMIDYRSPGYFDDLNQMDDITNPDTGEIILGDIVISVEHVIDQAEAYGHSQKREFAFLVAHSMFHLMGYDHMIESEAKIMEEKQSAVLDALEIKRK